MRAVHNTNRRQTSPAVRGYRSGHHPGVAIALAVVLASATAPTSAESLSEAYARAIESDPTYLAAVSGNRAAQELKPQARSALLPNVSLDANASVGEIDRRRASATGQRGPASFNSSSIGLNLTQPLYRPALLVALEQADFGVRQDNVLLAAARQDLIVRLATAYFGVLEAEDTLEFAQATKEAFDKQLEQSAERFEVGLIAITDVEEAKAGSDRARADVIVAQNALDTAHEALREITGSYSEALSQLIPSSLPLETPEPSDIQAWTDTALKTNLNLAAARLAADTARKEIRRQQAGHLPTLDLVASHTRDINNGDNTGDTRNWTSSVGLQLNVPIYEGGIVLSRTRESLHLHEQRLDLVEQASRNAQRETRNAYLGVESAISTIGALEQAVVSAEAARRAIQAGFEVGTRTSVDVLDADRNVFEASRDLAAARYQYIVDVVRLKQAAGTLADEDVGLINSFLE